MSWLASQFEALADRKEDLVSTLTKEARLGVLLDGLRKTQAGTCSATPNSSFIAMDEGKEQNDYFVAYTYFAFDFFREINFTIFLTCQDNVVIPTIMSGQVNQTFTSMWTFRTAKWPSYWQVFQNNISEMTNQMLTLLVSC